MRFLTTRRRHPLAKPLLLVLALFLMGGIYTVFSPAQKVAADTGDAALIQRGKELYGTNCSSCHGLNAEGTSQAPTLVGVGAASVDFQVGTGRMPAAGPAVQIPRKANPYSQADIDALAAYIASLGNGPAVPGQDKYNPNGLTPEQLARGGELFRTNCSACHNFAGKGGAMPEGRYAPNLDNTSPRHIWEAMRTGPTQMPMFSSSSISDEDARLIIGYLKSLNAQPAKGGLELGGLGPVAEGLWGWIAGIGVLCIVATWIASKGARAR